MACRVRLLALLLAVFACVAVSVAQIDDALDLEPSLQMQQSQEEEGDADSESGQSEQDSDSENEATDEQNTGGKAGAAHSMSGGFFSAFVASLSIIIVSELGDKTFFIAAIMAMRHPRAIVLAGALGALVVMTVLSVAVGFALPTFMPRVYTHYASAILFLFFGLRLLKDAWSMDPNGTSSELNEVEEELQESVVSSRNNTDLEHGDDNPSGKNRELIARFLARWFSPILLQSFTLTFLAEWGDRSQIATIALAAARDPWGVAVGGFLGHAACTGLAVVGGRLLAARISERTVSFAGGFLFLVFFVHSLWTGP